MKEPTRKLFCTVLAAVVVTSSAIAGVPGEINYQGRLRVDGTNFNGTARFKFALVDPGTDLNRTAQASATVSNGEIVGVTVTDGGLGYVDPPTVSFSGSGGATAEAEVANGQVAAINVLNGGSGYFFVQVNIAPPPPNPIHETYWSNDGDSVAGSEPGFAVGIPVVEGLFTVALGREQFTYLNDVQFPIMIPIPPSVFTNPAVHLRTWVDDGVNGFSRLTPDTPIGSAGYAMVASSVMEEGVLTSQLAEQSVTEAKLAVESVTESRLATNSVTGSRIADETVEPADLNLGSFNTTFWRTDGNAGTTEGTHFIGTTDETPFEIRAGGRPQLRIVPRTFGSPNIIGGSSSNLVTHKTVPTLSPRGVFIGGGGSVSTPNHVQDDYAVVTGGLGNTNSSEYGFLGSGFQNNLSGLRYGGIAAGLRNRLLSTFAFIGGGASNYLSGSRSVIGGGGLNRINEEDTVIGGGSLNTVFYLSRGSVISGGISNIVNFSSRFGAIGGGATNVIGSTSIFATIPGGNLNLVDGDYGFAAGRRARAVHDGAFVWADSQDANFSSTHSNQFLVRASGGVGININNPRDTLDVAGGVRAESASIDTTSGSAALKLHVGNSWSAYLRQSSSSVLTLENGGEARLFLTSGGRLGVGVQSPSQALHVSGNILATGTVSPSSDRNAKTDIRKVDALEMLDRVVNLPIRQWRFKEEDPGVKHVGPMAQDFRETFGLGETNTVIATVDADGVALAAIQGLHRVVEQQAAEMRAMHKEIEDLKSLIKDLIAAEQ